MNTESPSKNLNLPVIGKINCHIKGEKNNKAYFYKLDSFEVILIEHNGDETIYWCNVWESQDSAFKISSKYVKSFIKI